MKLAVAAGALAVMASALVACASGPKDVAVPASGEAAGSSAPPSSPEPEGYVYVARRPRATVGLAEARNLDDDTARRMIDDLADRLEACARNLESEGSLVSGAGRVVAAARPGEPAALNVTLAPGDAVAQNALLCLIAPVRALPFPPPTSGRVPALAIEATWNPIVSAPDAGR